MSNIYFVKCGEHIKIGVAAHVGKRVGTLQGGSAQPMELIAAVKGSTHDERALHKRLSAFRARGEWFRDCEEVRSVMAGFVERGDIADALPTTIPSENFGRAWKAIFPRKAAEELAARVGCSVRSASYQLSGEHDPSAQSILALIDAVTPKRKK